MTPKSGIIHPIPKYERLQRMAERYPSLAPDTVMTHCILQSIVDEVAAAKKETLARYGLSEGRLHVLALLLEHHPQPLSHSELAERSGVTKGNITGLVDGLQRDGHVRREDSEEDRRVSLISLTSMGQQLIEKILPNYFSRLAALMSELSIPERKTLVLLLTKVHAGLPAFRRE
jgi:DNA-binding MarR family transcriptional regulator